MTAARWAPGTRVGGLDDDGDFLDLVYATAAEPDLWVKVLELFADRVGGSSAFLSRLNVVDGSGSLVTARIDPAMPALYVEHYANCNPLNNVKDAAAYMRGWTPRILTDEDWMPKDDLIRTEYYNDFMRPQRVHAVMMVRLAVRDLDVCVVNVNRPSERGRFEKADIERARRLQPHLIRAFKLSERLSQARLLTEGMAAALDGSPYGVFLLDHEGRVRHANQTGETLLSRNAGLLQSGGRLSAPGAGPAHRLQALIAAAGASRSVRTGGTTALPSPSGGPPLSVSVAPLRPEHPAVFDGRPSVIVCVSDPAAGLSVREGVLHELFGFTPAETRVALSLCEGDSPRRTAERLGVSYHTVRHQLQSMYDKVGVNRQTDLMSLLTRTISAHAA